MSTGTPKRPTTVTRREFLKIGAAGTAAARTAPALGRDARRSNAAGRPNFLFIITDQQGLDTISALGCSDVRTPNLDRLVRSGVSFMESHSANPLCSPARSCLFTGRPTTETGVVTNSLPIRESMPNLGQWFGQAGYETVYIGKWHLPVSFTPNVKGFTVIPAGLGGQGTLGDGAISRASQAYLLNRERGKPFALVTSFLQPHDICQYVTMHGKAPDTLPFPDIADELPELPPNFTFDEREPNALKTKQRPSWSAEQWRYYIWSYHRMVEEVDAEIGRVVQALEDSGQMDDTIIVMTADHGEGRARHKMVTKNYLYDEAVKVPLIVSCPGRMKEDARDATHLVSGLDVLPTLCDYAKIKPPEHMRGKSLRPLLEGKRTAWHDFVAAEVAVAGRMIRTADYKYVTYEADPVEQLFDMKNDPWETKNLAGESRHAAALADHRKLLESWTAKLDVAPVPERVQRGVGQAKKGAARRRRRGAER